MRRFFSVGVAGAKGEGRDETAGRGTSAGIVRGGHHSPRAPAVLGGTGGDRRRYGLGSPPLLTGRRSESYRIFFVSIFFMTCSVLCCCVLQYARSMPDTYTRNT